MDSMISHRQLFSLNLTLNDLPDLHNFSKLPHEVRCQIWAATIEPRVLPLTILAPDAKRCKSRFRKTNDIEEIEYGFPPAMFVNREARDEIKRHAAWYNIRLPWSRNGTRSESFLPMFLYHGDKLVVQKPYDPRETLGVRDDDDFTRIMWEKLFDWSQNITISRNTPTCIELKEIIRPGLPDFVVLRTKGRMHLDRLDIVWIDIASWPQDLIQDLDSKKNNLLRFTCYTNGAMKLYRG